MAVALGLPAVRVGLLFTPAAQWEVLNSSRLEEAGGSGAKHCMGALCRSAEQGQLLSPPPPPPPPLGRGQPGDCIWAQSLWRQVACLGERWEEYVKQEGRRERDYW